MKLNQKDLITKNQKDAKTHSNFESKKTQIKQNVYISPHTLKKSKLLSKRVLTLQKTKNQVISKSNEKNKKEQEITAKKLFDNNLDLNSLSYAEKPQILSPTPKVCFNHSKKGIIFNDTKSRLRNARNKIQTQVLGKRSSNALDLNFEMCFAEQKNDLKIVFPLLKSTSPNVRCQKLKYKRSHFGSSIKDHFLEGRDKATITSQICVQSPKLFGHLNFVYQTPKKSSKTKRVKRSQKNKESKENVRDNNQNRDEIIVMRQGLPILGEKAWNIDINQKSTGSIRQNSSRDQRLEGTEQIYLFGEDLNDPRLSHALNLQNDSLGLQNIQNFLNRLIKTTRNKKKKKPQDEKYQKFEKLKSDLSLLSTRAEESNQSKPNPKPQILNPNVCTFQKDLFLF